jgi:type VI secretion system protein ImpG
VLGLYGFQMVRDPHAQLYRRVIEAIRSVKMESRRRILEEVLTLGVGVEIEAEAAGFASQGEAAVFGSVLHELLSSQVTCNSFSELKLRLRPEGAEFGWQPKLGYEPVV